MAPSETDEALDRVVVEVLEQRRPDRQRGGAGEQQRVAVRLGVGDRARADGGAAARAIVDDHGLPKARGDVAAHQARNGVGRPARRKRHDQFDGAVRIRLRGGIGEGEAGANGRDGEQKNRPETHRRPWGTAFLIRA
jgi:hypothetical protein